MSLENACLFAMNASRDFGASVSRHLGLVGVQDPRLGPGTLRHAS